MLGRVSNLKTLVTAILQDTIADTDTTRSESVEYKKDTHN